MAYTTIRAQPGPVIVVRIPRQTDIFCTLKGLIGVFKFARPETAAAGIVLNAVASGPIAGRLDAQPIYKLISGHGYLFDAK